MVSLRQGTVNTRACFMVLMHYLEMVFRCELVEYILFFVPLIIRI